MWMSELNLDVYWILNICICYDVKEMDLAESWSIFTFHETFYIREKLCFGMLLE